MTREPATRDGYEGRIGRYGRELAEALIAVAAVGAADRVLDVGCGSGPLTQQLVRIVGTQNVRAIDPDADAVAACRARVAGADVRVASAEQLPYSDAEFDAVLAQLVMPLVADAPRAVGEMRRVTRPGGTVATCVWDFAEGMTMLRAFWDAAASVDARTALEYDQARTRPYTTRRELEHLWHAARLRDVTSGELLAGAGYADFDDLWRPLAAPDGQPGRFLETLDATDRDALRDRLRRRLGSPSGAFRLTARAWYAVGRA